MPILKVTLFWVLMHLKVCWAKNTGSQQTASLFQLVLGTFSNLKMLTFIISIKLQFFCIQYALSREKHVLPFTCVFVYACMTLKCNCNKSLKNKN